MRALAALLALGVAAAGCGDDEGGRSGRRAFSKDELRSAKVALDARLDRSLDASRRYLPEGPWVVEPEGAIPDRRLDAFFAEHGEALARCADVREVRLIALVVLRDGGRPAVAVFDDVLTRSKKAERCVSRLLGERPFGRVRGKARVVFLPGLAGLEPSTGRAVPVDPVPARKIHVYVSATRISIYGVDVPGGDVARVEEALRAALGSDRPGDVELELESSADVPYDRLIAVMDAATRLGIVKIGFKAP